jgi:hypothetical protein
MPERLRSTWEAPGSHELNFSIAVLNLQRIELAAAQHPDSEDGIESYMMIAIGFARF